MPDFGAVERAFGTAIADGAFPGAVLLVAKEGEVVYRRAFGNRSLDPHTAPMKEDTIFDLSSLTKPLATTTAFLLLTKERKLLPDDRVTRLFHNFGVHGKTHVTFRHLLTHSSGFPAWQPYYKEVLRLENQGRVNFICSQGAKQFVYDTIQREKLERAPGEKTVYSDVGFMLVGQAIEDVTGVGLDRFCHDRIFRPLGLRSTSFVDLTLLRTRRLAPVTEMIAPTERCPWRNRVLCGEVHDDNAFVMGGVAGHAGLFSSADDVHGLVLELVKCFHGGGKLLPRDLVREAFRKDESVPESTRTLGWDTPSPEGSAAGGRFSKMTVGHLGFTGTSLWIDLERHIHVILLTNRVHPSRENERIHEVRPRIHDLVLDALRTAGTARR